MATVHFPARNVTSQLMITGLWETVKALSQRPSEKSPAGRLVLLQGHSTDAPVARTTGNCPFIFPQMAQMNLSAKAFRTAPGQQNPKPASRTRSRARDKCGWWPPLGWVGLISRSHAKKYPRTGHFSNVFCRIFVILCFGGNSRASRPSAFHGIRLTSGESIMPFING